MVEPEIAFIDLQQLMLVIETFIKFIVNRINNECKDEITFFSKDKPEIKNRINELIKKEFKKIEYKKVIELLTKAIKDGHKFEDNDIFFGKDLASEHERYICEAVYKGPVFVYNYPKKIKAFYMKDNQDEEDTVAACDLLVPGVGEIVGGSQREDNYEKLIKRCHDLKMDVSSIQ
jgi:asparaginyl-tRNA synthetase